MHRATYRLAAGAVVLALPLGPLPAQQPAPSATPVLLQNELKARAVLAAGIEAIGGLEALQSVSDVTRSLSGARTDWGQGRRPTEPSNNHPRLRSIRDLRGGRVYDVLEDTITGGQPLRFAAVSGPGGAASLNFVTGMVRTLPPAALTAFRAGRARQYPETVLLSAWARPEMLRWLGETRENGRPQQVVAFADADGEQVTLSFDAATHLLTKLEAVNDDPARGDLTTGTRFEDWRPVGRLKLPFRQVDFVGEHPLMDMRAASIELDTHPADSVFAIPAGFTAYQPAPPADPVTKLGDDVYAVVGGYNSMFVVFADYVLAVEAGQNARATQATIRRIRQVAPGKPIRYLVATHFHEDHIGGVRSYVAEGATIVTTPSARGAIERAARARHEIRPDALARAPKAPAFEVLSSGKRVFDDGTHRVELYQIGPTPHVDEMIIAYLPKERVLFEADALDLDVPAEHTGTGAVGDDTADLARKIDALGLTVDRIVPVHGRIGTIADLRESLARRAAAR